MLREIILPLVVMMVLAAFNEQRALAAETAVSSGNVKDGHFAYVLDTQATRWPGGLIRWYYNPAGQPAGFTTEQVVAILQSAAAQWQTGCNVQFQYAGLASMPTFVQDGMSVVGWQSGLGTVSGQTQKYSTANQLVEADIRLNSQSVTDVGVLRGVVLHEFGHMLGLSHSEQPDSVMYSNPYHTATFQAEPKGDDLIGCAALYGSPGFGASVLHDDLVPQLNPGETASLYVTTSQPSSAPSESLDAITPNVSGTVYFTAVHAGFAAGEMFTIELIAPDGTLYFVNSRTGVNGNGYTWVSVPWSAWGASYLSGTWQLAFLAGNIPKAVKRFSVLTASVPPLPPEIAIIGRPVQGAPLAYSFDAINLTPGRAISLYQWSFDGAATLSGQNQPATFSGAGTHTIQLFATSSWPRYPGLNGSGSGQGSGPDYGRRVTFELPGNGIIVAPAISGTTSGLSQAFSLQADMVIPQNETGTKNIYVLAFAGGEWFYKTPGGWSVWQGISDPEPLLSVNAPAVVSIGIADEVDARLLPAGILVYAGYGNNFGAVVATGRYANILTFP